VAIGDIHGDLHKARQAFRLGGLIDDEDRWCGGKTVAVQVGDQLDRGHDEVAVLHLLERLKVEAAQAGGALHVLLGNHETMNARGQFRYATHQGRQDFYRWHLYQRLGSAMKALAGMPRGLCDYGLDLPTPPSSSSSSSSSRSSSSSSGIYTDARYSDNHQDQMMWDMARWAALGPGQPIARHVLATNPVVLQIGSTVFAHGGIHMDHVTHGLDKINRETHEWLVNGKPRAQKEEQKLMEIQARGAAMPSFLSGANAVVWSRRYSHPKEEHCDCAHLAMTLDQLSAPSQSQSPPGGTGQEPSAGIPAPHAKRMVVGHTIQPHGANGACDGRVIRVDVGMSQGCGNHEPEVIEIIHDGVLVRRLRIGQSPQIISGHPVGTKEDPGTGPQEVEVKVRGGGGIHSSLHRGPRLPE